MREATPSRGVPIARIPLRKGKPALVPASPAFGIEIGGLNELAGNVRMFLANRGRESGVPQRDLDKFEPGRRLAAGNGRAAQGGRSKRCFRAVAAPNDRRLVSTVRARLGRAQAGSRVDAFHRFDHIAKKEERYGSSR